MIRKEIRIALLDFSIESGRRTFHAPAFTKAFPGSFQGGLTSSPGQPSTHQIERQQQTAIARTVQAAFSSQPQQQQATASIRVQQSMLRSLLTTQSITQRQFNISSRYYNHAYPELQRTERFQHKSLDSLREISHELKTLGRELKHGPERGVVNALNQQTRLLSTINSSLQPLRRALGGPAHIGLGIPSLATTTPEHKTNRLLSGITRSILPLTAGFKTLQSGIGIINKVTSAFGTLTSIPGRVTNFVSRHGLALAGGAAGGLIGGPLGAAAGAATGGALGGAFGNLLPLGGLIAGLGSAYNQFQGGNIAKGLIHGAAGIASITEGLGPFVGIALASLGTLIPKEMETAFNEKAGSFFQAMIPKIESVITSIFGEERIKSFKETISKGLEAPIISTFTSVISHFGGFFNKILIEKSQDKTWSQQIQEAIKEHIITPTFNSIGEAIRNINWTDILKTAIADVIRPRPQPQKWLDEDVAKARKGVERTQQIPGVSFIPLPQTTVLPGATAKATPRNPLAGPINTMPTIREANQAYQARQELYTSLIEQQKNLAQAHPEKLDDIEKDLTRLTEEMQKEREVFSAWIKRNDRLFSFGYHRANESFPIELHKPISAREVTAPIAPTIPAPGIPAPVATKPQGQSWSDWFKGLLNTTTKPAEAATVKADQIASIPVVRQEIQGATTSFTESVSAAGKKISEVFAAITKGIREKGGPIGADIADMLTEVGKEAAIQNKLISDTIKKNYGLGTPSAPTQRPATAPRIPAGQRSFTNEDLERLKGTSQAIGSSADPAWIAAVDQIESRGNPNAVSSTGAKGVMQFTEKTGRQYGLLQGGKDLRGNVQASADAAARLAEDNKTALQSMGIPTDPHLLYIAHQQGAHGLQEIMAAAQSGTDVSPARRATMDVQSSGKGLSPQKFLETWKDTFTKEYEKAKASLVGKTTTTASTTPVKETTAKSSGNFFQDLIEKGSKFDPLSWIENSINSIMTTGKMADVPQVPEGLLSSLGITGEAAQGVENDLRGMMNEVVKEFNIQKDLITGTLYENYGKGSEDQRQATQLLRQIELHQHEIANKDDASVRTLVLHDREMELESIMKMRHILGR